MRRHASEWTGGMQPRNNLMPDAESVPVLEGSSSAAVTARARRTGGVFDLGTREEDGPETWEIPLVL